MCIWALSHKCKAVDLADFTKWMSFLNIKLENDSETNSECKYHRVSKKHFKPYNRLSFWYFHFTMRNIQLKKHFQRTIRPTTMNYLR